MNTAAFLNQLRNNTSKSLIFEFAGQAINKGYHVTEFKAINVNSMDCGGKTNAWNETVLHVTAPQQAASEEIYMSVAKFLSLYKKVATNIMNVDDALMRVEYAASNGIAINYIVDDIEVSQNSLIVKTLAPGTSCKAIDYLTGNVPLAVIADDFGCC